MDFKQELESVVKQISNYTAEEFDEVLKRCGIENYINIENANGIKKNIYIIAGYDLTDFRKNNYEAWRESREWFNMTCNQTKGYIQIFDSYLNGEFLYLGYVLECDDVDSYIMKKININEIKRQEIYVKNKLKQLIDNKILEGISNIENLKYEIIVFEDVFKKGLNL